MAPIDLRTLPGCAALRPGEWAAVADGRVIAHGLDLREVAQEACRKASDIAFERVPASHAPTCPPDPSFDEALARALPRVRSFFSRVGAPPRREAPPLPWRR